MDYASRVDPYDAMVLSATLLNPTKALIERCRSNPEGPLLQWILEAERMDALVRRVSDELFLALWLEAGALSARLLAGIDPLVELLRRESGLVSEGGGGKDALEVETRQAKGWGYAPRSVRSSTVPSTELEVLGRWTEPGAFAGQEAVCFRVRAANVEWTLVHDPGLERWYRR